jgi:hypothetical protein
MSGFTVKLEYAELDIAKLSDKELSELIRRAMSEFQHRLDNPRFDFVNQPAPKAVAFKPPVGKIAFIKNCLKKEYVHAEMKDEYKALAKEYADWFRSQGYPSDLRGSTMKRWKEYGA